MHARKKHLPLRGASKLCSLMHEALLGNVFWHIIITVGPSVDYLLETTTSLLFGKRAMHHSSVPIWSFERALTASAGGGGRAGGEGQDSPLLLQALQGDDPLLASPGLSADASPSKKRGAAMAAGPATAKQSGARRQAKTTSPATRRRISFHYSARLRSLALDNPDIEFSHYVARQLSGDEHTPGEALNESLSRDMNIGAEWVTRGDVGGGEGVRKRRLAFEQVSEPLRPTGSALSAAREGSERSGTQGAAQVQAEGMRGGGGGEGGDGGGGGGRVKRSCEVTRNP